MTDRLAHLDSSPDDATPLAESLAREIHGDVRFDALARTLYATDAGIHQIVPQGVVWPRTVEDVVRVVRKCHQRGASVIARGAGTGLTGGAIGAGVALDLSRYLCDIAELDPDMPSIEVGPGVVLDELNVFLAASGLMFAPDVATSSRATIGGMIANNSCGARSIRYGRTVDHVLGLSVVLGDGQLVGFGDAPAIASVEAEASLARVAKIEKSVGQIRDNCFDEIQRRFPKILRSNAGYGLDRLGPRSTPCDLVKILCGSEGTLGVIVRAKLGLVPIVQHSALVVLHFDSVLAALSSTPQILGHDPSAVELVDRLILDAARSSFALRRRRGFLVGNPSALLIVEFQSDDKKTLKNQVDTLVSDSDVCSATVATSALFDSQGQRDVWDFRKSGLGLLMSKPGNRQPIAFVEDTAVDPARLHDYIERFGAILDSEGVEGSYYAHASVGCIHVRPILNLKKNEDVKRLSRIADAVSSLALEFGGTMTGEHGDGIVRSVWLEKMYGPKITEAFKKIKQLFDPDGVLNPYKIVDPCPITDHLRYERSQPTKPIKTYLDFSAHNGMAGLAEMCSGVGECRKRLVGTMCPSYMATADEMHTTRARANALRAALSDRGLLDGLDDEQLAEVMELCISCKACRTECPTGVDMAKLKAEYLSRRHLVHGVGRRQRFLAELPQRLARASRFPRLVNLIAGSPMARGWMERRYGLDRRLRAPALARQTFRSWFRHHRRKRGNADGPRGSVVYFVDTWTNYLAPQVGIAAVKLLERAGFEVLCPKTQCCGRVAISQGLLAEGQRLAQSNVDRLARIAAMGGAIVGTEPSCILTLVDEYPQLVRTTAARQVASRAMMIENFLERLLEEHPDALAFRPPDSELVYHSHCHQKALVGSDGAVGLLRRVWGDGASSIDSGCCGMAGAFGHEVEHYNIARAIGDQKLFPAVRDRGNAVVIASGFSCRQQIEHHTGTIARHPVELLADALV